MTPTKEQLDALVRELVDRGKLVEAGWTSFRYVVLPPQAGDAQLDAMRSAFYGGAQHIFGSIMQMLEPGDEPSEKDLNRMTKISDELSEYVHEMRARLVRKPS